MTAVRKAENLAADSVELSVVERAASLVGDLVLLKVDWTADSKVLTMACCLVAKTELNSVGEKVSLSDVPMAAYLEQM